MINDRQREGRRDRGMVGRMVEEGRKRGREAGKEGHRESRRKERGQEDTMRAQQRR